MLTSLQVICVITHRLFLHPLAKYPGPKLGALSNWYTAILVGQGVLHLHIRQWHDHYGKGHITLATFTRQADVV